MIILFIAFYSLGSHKLQGNKVILETKKGAGFKLSSKGLTSSGAKAKFTIKDGNTIKTFDVGGKEQIYITESATQEVQILIDGKPAMLNFQALGSFTIWDKDSNVRIQFR